MRGSTHEPAWRVRLSSLTGTQPKAPRAGVTNQQEGPPGKQVQACSKEGHPASKHRQAAGRGTQQAGTSQAQRELHIEQSHTSSRATQRAEPHSEQAGEPHSKQRMGTHHWAHRQGGRHGCAQFPGESLLKRVHVLIPGGPSKEGGQHNADGSKHNLRLTARDG